MRGVLAVFRPRSNDIAIYAEDGRHGPRASAFSIEEAQALHATLGTALHLASCREQPLKAVAR